MAKFIALPVGRGDAFYLDRGNGTILVDGGMSRSALPDMFRRVTGKDSVDILVCTHNDADHVNGVLGFLESELTCGELWLPGRWLAVLPDVLAPLDEFAEKVFGEIERDRSLQILARDFGNTRSNEEYAARFEENSPYIEPVPNIDMDREDDGTELSHDGWPPSLVGELENAQSWDRTGGGWPHRPWGWIEFFYNYPQDAHIIISSLIDAASRIREAAILAFHKGVTVRWFEHSPFDPHGGISGLLVPANARQLLKMRCRKRSLVEYISLTVVNRESLVCWAPPTERMPGVLFNADSDLANMSPPEGIENSIATAPHHGSESNGNVYDKVSKASGDGKSVTWVRSDGRSLKRPGNSYLTKTSKRFCTLCRSGSYSAKPKQAVRLFTSKGRWVRHKDCQSCECRL